MNETKHSFLFMQERSKNSKEVKIMRKKLLVYQSDEMVGVRKDFARYLLMVKVNPRTGIIPKSIIKTFLRKKSDSPAKKARN